MCVATNQDSDPTKHTFFLKAYMKLERYQQEG